MYLVNQIQNDFAGEGGGRAETEREKVTCETDAGGAPHLLRMSGQSKNQCVRF